MVNSHVVPPAFVIRVFNCQKACGDKEFGETVTRSDPLSYIEYELENFARTHGRRVVFNKEARESFLRFAKSEQSSWTNNFRDLNGAITRMATLESGGRINVDSVREEIERLNLGWGNDARDHANAILHELLGPEKVADLDRFDRVQLNDVLTVCRSSKSMSDAGRRLFSASRKRRKIANDADRLRKYLGKFGIQWNDVHPSTR